MHAATFGAGVDFTLLVRNTSQLVKFCTVNLMPRKKEQREKQIQKERTTSLAKQTDPDA